MNSTKSDKFVFKNLRWGVLTLVMLITIINYLDRGTLNYMWVANSKINYPVVQNKTQHELPFAIFESLTHNYILYNSDGSSLKIAENSVIKNAESIQYVKRGGIAADLGLINENDSPSVTDSKLKKLYSYIYLAFMIAYGISQLISGKMFDKIGTRNGFIVSAFIWGTADMLTSLAKGTFSLSFFRVLLGLGEAGPWPGTVKSNAEWFPVKERALAQGLFGAGGSIGNILAPLIISSLYLSFGWQNTFIIIGSLGLFWTIPWYILNKKKPAEHPWISEEERNYILSGQTEINSNQAPTLSWKDLLSDKKSYAVILGRFFLDPIWWMFVAWLPIYLSNKFNLDIKQVAFSAWVPFVGAAIGAIIGGWHSGKLISKGKSAIQSRKIAILIGGGIILPAMIAAAFASTVLIAVLLMAVILGGFQFAVVNIQTLPSDFHSGKTVGSLAGLGGASAVFGTIITMILVPYITEGNNWIPFFVMGALLVPSSILCIMFFSTNKFLRNEIKG